MGAASSVNIKYKLYLKAVEIALLNTYIFEKKSWLNYNNYVTKKKETIRIVCRNFGNPTLTLSVTKYNIYRWKIDLQKLWIDCQYWICFSLRMVIYYLRSMPTASTKCVNLEFREGVIYIYWSVINWSMFEWAVFHSGAAAAACFSTLLRKGVNK